MTAKTSRFGKTLLKHRIGKEVNEPPINFSLEVKHTHSHMVKIEVDTEIKELLNKILEKLPGDNKATSEIIQEALNEPALAPNIEEDIDEPAELAVNIPMPLKEPYGHIVYAKDLPDEYNRIKEFPALGWKENDNRTLTVTYHGATVGDALHKLTWSTIEKLLTFPKNKRMSEILKIKGVDKSNNKKTALSVFCQCVERGLITPYIPPTSIDPDIESEKNFTQFIQEEDPDAPMLAKYYSTRPDPNAGKVEGSLEAI